MKEHFVILKIYMNLFYEMINHTKMHMTKKILLIKLKFELYLLMLIHNKINIFVKSL
jgi:hypothetical protein